MLTAGSLYCAVLSALSAQRFHVTGVSSDPYARLICGALLLIGASALAIRSFA